MPNFNHPLMFNNITRSDTNEIVNFLNQDPIPQLTNGPKVREFEEAWSKWLGVKYSLFVNSGSSANQLTMLALKNKFPNGGDIIVPPLTWVSDIASVIQNGFNPVFCDINLRNLSFDFEKLKKLAAPKTRALFLTHVLGFNGLTEEILKFCVDNNILLIEDVCESYGADFKNEKLGSFGFASNFSFFYAHSATTIEGGIISTNDKDFYQNLRAYRSHGMAREMTDEERKFQIIKENPDLNKDFIFLAPAYNFRSTEINAVLGLNQLKRLDANNEKRKRNFRKFIAGLDSSKYITDFDMAGQCNYAFIVILKESSFEKRDLVEKTLGEKGIEFRRGLSGGGNQLRQPYMRTYKWNPGDFPNVEHVHHFSWYIGNYPELETEKIDYLLEILNNI